MKTVWKNGTAANPVFSSTGQKLAALAMNVESLQDATNASSGKTEKEFADCLALIIQLIAEDRTSKDIARELGISVKTADAHRTNIMRKLDLHSVSALVRYAIRNRIAQA